MSAPSEDKLGGSSSLADAPNQAGPVPDATTATAAGSGAEPEPEANEWAPFEPAPDLDTREPSAEWAAANLQTPKELANINSRARFKTGNYRKNTSKLPVASLKKAKSHQAEKVAKRRREKKPGYKISTLSSGRNLSASASAEAGRRGGDGLRTSRDGGDFQDTIAEKSEEYQQPVFDAGENGEKGGK